MVRREARGELRDRAAREGQDAGQPQVHARRPDLLRREHPGGLLAGQQPGATDAVAADVHQRAAVEVGPEPDVGLVLEGEREGRPDRLEAADRRQQLEDALRLAGVPPHERLHQDEPGAIGGVERLGHLLGPPGVRLLAQHVLAGRQAGHRPRVVERVRDGDVDRVDPRVREHRLVRAEGPRDLVLPGVCLGPRRVAARDRHDLDLARQSGAPQELPVDVAGAEDAPADSLAHASSDRGHDGSGGDRWGRRSYRPMRRSTHGRTLALQWSRIEPCRARSSSDATISSPSPGGGSPRRRPATVAC